MYLLQDIMLDALVNIIAGFASHNLGIPTPRPEDDPTGHLHLNTLRPIMDKVLGCFGYVVYTALPVLIEANTKQGSDWSRLLIDQIRFMLWGLHRCKHIDFSGKSDSEFRRLFEQEWRELLQYQDGFYGFRVIPNISIQDMVRYQNTPHGDAIIRRAISAYLTHQATEYPHWIKPLSGKFTEVAFERRIRECYRPLVESLADEAMENLTAAERSKASNHHTSTNWQKMRNDVLEQLWQQYEAARDDYQFYWNAPGRQRPLGKIGFVGLQDVPIKEKLDALMEQQGLPFRTRDISEVAFAHFIRERLRNWVESVYPADRPHYREVSLDSEQSGNGRPLQEVLSGQSSWNADANTMHAPTSTVEGIDGIAYITIYQAAERAGMTVDQLRRLDKKGFLPCKRVKDVCQKPWTLTGGTRLYPLTAEGDRALQLAKARLAKHSSQLEGEEVDRKTAAKLVGVSPAALCKWEAQGLVQPGRKGKIVVYGATALEQAQQVVASRKTKMAAV